MLLKDYRREENTCSSSTWRTRTSDVLYMKLTNELYTLKHQEKRKQIIVLDWLKKIF